MFGWQDVLDFWFGPLDENGVPDSFHRNRWFRSSRATDQEIRRRFMSLVAVASEEGVRDWRVKPGGRLAEILLLDQFSRHIYRGGELAFSNDLLARKVCREGVSAGAEVSLPGIQRAFFYMPLKHSERLPDQDLAVDLYEQLAAQEVGPMRDFLDSFTQSAIQHRDIIQRFGRFPHRNRALKRQSTEEELSYLAGGSRFGQ